MLVKDVGKVSTALADSPLSRSKLWTRHVHTITSTDITAFVRENRARGLGSEAVHNADVLIAEAIKLIARGKLQAVSFLDYSPPEPVFGASELVGMLDTLPIQRRKAVLFGLEMDMPIRAVLGLTWSASRRLKPTMIAATILKGAPRHLRLQYVFWEYLDGGVAAPLFGLEESAMDASYGLGYDRLRGLYKKMIWIDEDAEAKDFMNMIEG